MSTGFSTRLIGGHFLFVWLGGLMLFCSPLAAQTDEEKDRELQRSQRQFQFEVGKMQRAGSFASEADRTKFNNYHNVTIERFKLKSNRSELPKLRQRIARDLMNAGNAPNPAVHDALNDLLRQAMEKIAFDTATYDPVVRYNAMLQLAHLSEKEFSFGSGADKPLPAALPILIKGFTDNSLGDAVQVAALLGIQRHAQAGAIDANSANTISALMLKTFNDQKVPEDRRTIEAHDWIRRTAAEVLASLGSTGANNTVVQALLDVVKNPKESLGLRCAAAKALGVLNYGGGRLNFTLIGHTLGDLAVEITEKHAESSKRRIRAYLAGAMIGLGGADPNVEEPAGIVAIGGEHQAFVMSVFKHVMAINAIFDDSKITPEEAPEKLKEAGETLKQFLANAPLQNQQLTVR